MKKNICGLLVGLVMMFPFLANAEEVENYAKIGDNEYATLKEAVEAAEVCTDLSTCDVTTIEVVASHETSGIVFAEGKNLVIDLGGFTVTFNPPTVGSKGTETIDMQILKNSNVTFQNGKFVSSDTDKSKMFIQNYANLTLKDVEIVAMNDLNQYAVSNNSGDVNIIGNTSIKAKSVAFDVCGFHAHGYKIGPKVVVDTTGTIEGTIEVSAEEGEKTRELSLLVKNMNHVGEFSVLSEDLNDNIKFEDGSKVYTVVDGEETKSVVAADKEVIDTPYIKDSSVGEDFDKDMESFNKEMNNFEVEIEEAIKLLEEAGEEIPEAFEEYKQFIIDYKKTLENKKLIAGYDILYGRFIDEMVVSGKEEMQPNKKVSVTLDIPEGLEKVKEGYTRKFNVIRIHNEVVEEDDGTTRDRFEIAEINAKDNGDGTLTFETDKFSTYILAYEDVLDVNNVKTFDGITSYIILGGLSLVALIAVSVVTKKKAFN